MEQVVQGLVCALGRLSDGDEQYVIVYDAAEPGWLDGVLGPNQTSIVRPPSWKTVLGPLRAPVGRLVRGLRRIVRPPRGYRQAVQSHPADPFLNALSADIVHYPHQGFRPTDKPMVYNPHDLQHRRFPEFFEAEVLAWREATYAAGCRLAKAVVMSSCFARAELVRELSVPDGKAYVIPWAPPTAAHPEPSSGEAALLQQRYDLRGPFAYYPAATWRHKNHARLLDAMSFLRDGDARDLRLVCSGKLTSEWPALESRVHELGLSERVAFLGQVPSSAIRSLYRLARFVVVPTLYDPASAPIYEAWSEGLAVCCSAAGGLPEQVGEAALLFDPTDVQAIADALRALHLDADLRRKLVLRGHERLQLFTWERSARSYRALYRFLEGRQLSSDDTKLLAESASSQPQVTGP